MSSNDFERKLTHIKQFSYVFCGAALAYAIIFYFILNNFIPVYALIVAALLLPINPWLTRKTNSPALGCNFINTIAVSTELIICFYTGGVHSPATPWLVITPLIAIFVEEFKIMAFWWLTSIASVCALYFMEKFGYQFINHTSSEYINMIMFLSIVGLSITVVYLVYNS